MRLLSRDEIAILALINGVALLSVGLTRHFDTRDFDVFYASASLMAQGADPYSGLASLNTNPPHMVWVMTPLTVLGDAAAYWAWTAVSVLALAWSVFRVSSVCRLPVNRFVLAAIVGNAGTFGHVAGGQVAWVLAALMTEAWLAASPLISGVLVGLCASVKPFLLLFVPFFLYRRDWMRAAGTILGIGVVFCLGMVTLGGDVYDSWRRTLTHLNTAYHAGNGALLGVVSRLAQPDAIDLLSQAWVRLLWAVSALLLLAVVGRWLGTRHERAREWSVVLVSALLVSPLGQPYYLALVLGPLWKTLATSSWPPWSIGLVGLFWWPNLLTSPEPPTRYWQLVPYAFTGIGVLTLWLMLIRQTTHEDGRAQTDAAIATGA